MQIHIDTPLSLRKVMSRPKCLHLLFLSVNSDMSNRKRKEISRRKVLVNFFSNKRLLFLMIHEYFVYVDSC